MIFENTEAKHGRYCGALWCISVASWRFTAGCRSEALGSFCIFREHIIKHFNGGLCDANKKSVPTEALNPLRIDDVDIEFVIDIKIGWALLLLLLPKLGMYVLIRI